MEEIMIKPLFPYLHICECGHLNTNKSPSLEKCEALVNVNKSVYLSNPDDCIFDNKRNLYLKKCCRKIDRTHILPNKLEFTEVYSREIFDGLMKGHELSEYFYELHKNVAQINMSLDEIAKRMKIKLRNTGNNQRRK